MIERAIMQYVVTERDGSHVTREALRPAEVRKLAQRVHDWHFGGAEKCQRCKNVRAVYIRDEQPLCLACRDRVQVMEWGDVVERARFTGGTSNDNLIGHAVIFNSRSLDLGGFIEIVKPEAVNRTLNDKHADVLALWNHDSNIPLGRESAGTLRIHKDDIGLAVAIDPPASAAAQVEAVQLRNVKGMSFGFVTMSDEWYVSDGVPHRDLLDVAIHEISATAFPAYPQTDLAIGAPLTREWKPSLRHREYQMRAAGL
jgi:HK97 family phage prohead protease